MPVKSQLPPGFRLQVGKRCDRALLMHCLWHSYQAVNPQVASDHLVNLLDQYWTEATPVWFAYAMDTEMPCGCLWLGRAVDALTGERYTHVFLVYVAPDYRRRGLGSALMAHAEQWAAHQGDRQMGLQVFTGHQPAQQLYQSLGYQSQSLSLVKAL
ncbi:GNAT family N-acetyltransferase [Synechococcales cyanobacterium C]|uniref:GNAT family N-acetyltransferase n=1 Tax=Petrachloros mirabilis ULC683 TaxID=2781853 RepID=A0A8K1ZWF8_9CYAN|nr:GNAT family N-acetyltransferase [Petrachloros mirabilis]NCJ06404.1 GNAT family N-acetyltransferase [Petrachloros mirabilis ULC683]